MTEAVRSETLMDGLARVLTLVRAVASRMPSAQGRSTALLACLRAANMAVTWAVLGSKAHNIEPHCSPRDAERTLEQLQPVRPVVSRCTMGVRTDTLQAHAHRVQS